MCCPAVSPARQPARAVVIGGGVSGWNATQIAVGMGFHVTLLDRDINKLREADKIFGTKVRTVISNAFELEKAVLDADLVIGAVLIPGAKAPKLVTNELVSRMKPGSVLVDIAIDQGGCFEDSRPTTHAEPTFPVHNSVFYCVANMPGAVPNTSTYALTNATLPYIVELANRGWAEALRRDPALAKGLNTHDGKVVYREVAEAHGLEHVELRRCSADPDRRGKSPFVKAIRQQGASTRTHGRTLPEQGPAGCVYGHFATLGQLAVERNPLTDSHTGETCRATAVRP